MEYKMTTEQIADYKEHLRLEERSGATVEKYIRDIRRFYTALPEDKLVDKRMVLAWKERMIENYSGSTVNTMMAAVNSFFAFQGWEELRVRSVRLQRKIYRDKEQELSKEEYLRLLSAARGQGKDRLYYLMQTLSATGIRISELSFITVEAVRRGWAQVDCKGKQRTILITKRLRFALLGYCEKKKIRSGAVFCTRSGQAMDRSNIWRELRRLCEAAGVEPEKVFPHNFRHLFAVTFYRQEKDIAKLADLLGHASIETTRIYIMESGAEHERQVERLGLVL